MGSVRTAQEDSWVQNPTRNPKNKVHSALQQLIMADARNVTCKIMGFLASVLLLRQRNEIQKHTFLYLYTRKPIDASVALRTYLWCAYSTTLMRSSKYNTIEI